MMDALYSLHSGTGPGGYGLKMPQLSLLPKDVPLG